MAFDPDIHRRRSIRLPDYDYAQPGANFFTICTQDRVCLFGEIQDDAMYLNEAGDMVWQWWGEVASKFPYISAGEFVAMPDHVHGILNIVESQPSALDQAPVPRIIQWFKTMTTNAYIRGVKERGWPPFPGKLWQRNYYEHVIRDDDELRRASECIAYNPSKWHEDTDNPNNRE